MDDELIEKFLGGETLTPDEIRAALRKGTIEQKMYPMLCGSAFKNKGVQNLLDAVLWYLPSPLDVGAVNGINPDNGARPIPANRRIPRPSAHWHSN